MAMASVSPCGMSRMCSQIAAAARTMRADTSHRRNGDRGCPFSPAGAVVDGAWRRHLARASTPGKHQTAEHDQPRHRVEQHWHFCSRCEQQEEVDNRGESQSQPRGQRQRQQPNKLRPGGASSMSLPPAARPRTRLPESFEAAEHAHPVRKARIQNDPAQPRVAARCSAAIVDRSQGFGPCDDVVRPCACDDDPWREDVLGDAQSQKRVVRLLRFGR